MLPCVCSVIDHRRRQNVVRTPVTRSPSSSSVTFLFLPQFDVICDLLLNRRSATWSLFVKLILRINNFLPIKNFALPCVRKRSIESRHLREYDQPAEMVFRQIQRSKLLSRSWGAVPNHACVQEHTFTRSPIAVFNFLRNSHTVCATTRRRGVGTGTGTRALSVSTCCRTRRPGSPHRPVPVFNYLE